MLDPAILALTWRVTRRRVVGSPPALAAALALPAFVAWIGFHDSYGTAARIFYFLLPTPSSSRPRTRSGRTSRAAPWKTRSFRAAGSGAS